MRVSIPQRYFSLLAAGWLVSACGDSGTGPKQTPNVTGLYQWREQVAAVTCTPQRPPEGGGTVILGAFAFDFPVRIQQAGSQLTVIDINFPNDPGPTGTIDQNGNITLGYVVDFQEDPRTGNRNFFVHLTADNNLQVAANGARLVGTGSYVNVFRENSASAPVFATCSRTSTLELTRTGG